MSGTVRLSEVAEIIMGQSPPGDSYNSQGEGWPLLNGPTEFGSHHPKATAYSTKGTRFSKPGDLLFCVRGSTTGRMNWSDQKYVLGRGIALIRGSSDLETKFIRFALVAALQSLLQRAGGSTFPNLSKRDFDNFEIPWPARRERIASILSAYDELIELNTRRIAILEEMTRRLFDEWFGQPRHPDPQRLAGSSTPDWVATTFGAVCTSLTDGDWIETKDQGGTNFRLLQVSNIGTGQFIETGNYRFVTQSTFTRLRCTEIVSGDILVARMPKPTGRAWLVTEMPWRMITAVDVAIAKVDSAIADPYFVFYHLNSKQNLDLVEKHQTGTTRARISRSALSGLPIMLPPLSAQRQFGAFAASTYELQATLQRSNVVLRAARDVLLPKLISGEINLERAESQLRERAAAE